MDGGIVQFNLATETFTTLLTETQAGLELSDAIILSSTRGFAIGSGSDFSSSLIAFNPTTNAVTATLVSLSGSNGGYYPEMAMGKSDRLYLADRNVFDPGIRIFDTISLTAIARSDFSWATPFFDGPG